MSGREVFDTHAHLWDTSALPYSWLAKDATHPFPGLSDMGLVPRFFDAAAYHAQLGEHELAGAIIVEGGADAGQAAAEVDWIAGQLNALGGASRTVAHLDMTHDHADEHIDRLSNRADVIGVRQILNWDREGSDWNFTSHNLLEDPEFRRRFEHLAQASLSFDAQIWSGQFRAMADLCRETPDARVVLDHCGMPLGWASDDIAPWSDAISVFESVENATMKVSGLGMFRRDWSVSDAAPLLERIFDVFGPERIAFGSNFPVDAGSGSITELIDKLGDWAAPKDGGFADLFFRENGLRAYGLSRDNSTR